MSRLLQRQLLLWLPLLLTAGLISLTTAPLIDGAWLLMVLVGAGAVIDTRKHEGKES